jgi:hypothetical protein
VLLWERLAELLRGPAYEDGPDAEEFPLLKKFGGTQIYERILSPEKIEPTDDVTAFITQFHNACWHVDPPSLYCSYDARFHNDPNPLNVRFWLYS